MSRFTFTLFLIFISIVSISSSIFADVQNNAQVNTGVGPVTVNVCSACRKVTNTAGTNAYIPADDCSSWNTFIGNSGLWPAGITLGACCTSHASTGCPAAPGGDRYWYDSCGVQEDILEICSGDICIDADNNRHRTGCSGGSCTFVDQYCGPYRGTTYCGSPTDLRWNSGCVDPNGCQSNTVTTCQNGNFFCDVNAPNNRYQYTGCQGAAPAACTWNFIETCNNGGYYCDGNDRRQYTGCSSGSCTTAYVETCANGCSGGNCIANCGNGVVDAGEVCDYASNSGFNFDPGAYVWGTQDCGIIGPKVRICNTNCDGHDGSGPYCDNI